MHLEQSLACSKCSINVARRIHFYIARTGTEKVLLGCMVGGELEHLGSGDTELLGGGPSWKMSLLLTGCEGRR